MPLNHKTMDSATNAHSEKRKNRLCNTITNKMLIYTIKTYKRPCFILWLQDINKFFLPQFDSSLLSPQSSFPSQYQLELSKHLLLLQRNDGHSVKQLKIISTTYFTISVVKKWKSNSIFYFVIPCILHFSYLIGLVEQYASSAWFIQYMESYSSETLHGPSVAPWLK